MSSTQISDKQLLEGARNTFCKNFKKMFDWNELDLMRYSFLSLECLWSASAKRRMSSLDKVPNERKSRVKDLFIFRAEQKRANPVLRQIPDDTCAAQ